MNCTRRLFLAAALAVVAATAPAQPANPDTARTTVETRALDEGGQKVTERTITTVVREAAPKPTAPTVAIFVANRAGKAGEGELAALEDYVTGSVTRLDMRVISRETALEAVAGMTPGADANALDEQLAQSTSAVRIAQALGASHLLQVTIAGFEAQRKSIDAYGVKTTNEEFTARVTYKVLDGVSGASLAADNIRVTRLVQNTSAMANQHPQVLNSLLEEAAEQVASRLERELSRGRLDIASANQAMVVFHVSTEAADLYIPDVRVSSEGTVAISEGRFKVADFTATIEIDGIAVGTAPGAIQARAGLHKLRVARDGYKPWEHTVNLADGQRLVATLEMTDASYSRWKDATEFINGLKNGARLTDAQVKVLEGYARMLEQSGIKVDTREGISITHRSLF